MAYDYTFSSGNKTAHTSRNNGGRIDTGQTRVQRMDTKREIPDIQPDLSGIAAVDGLAGALGDFFKVQSKEEFHKEELAEKEKNALAISEAKANIAQDREGAREAVKTGDFSKFVSSDEMRNRKVVQQSFLQMVGAEAGLEDYESDYRHAVRQTPVDGDPRASLAEAMSHNLRGAEPIYAEAYTGAAIKSAEPDIRLWKTARKKGAILKAEATSIAVADAAFTAGHVNSLSDFHGGRDKTATSLMVPTPLGFRKSDAIWENAAIKAVAMGGPNAEKALRILEAKDPRLDGRSIIERRKLDIPKIVAQYRAGQIAFKSAQAWDDHDALADMLTNVEAGVAGAGDAFMALQGFYAKHGEATRQNPSMKALTKRLFAANKATLGLRTIVGNIDAGSTATDSKMAHDVIEEHWLSGGLTAATSAKRGTSMEKALGTTTRWVAKQGINTATQTNLMNMLTFADPKAQERAFAILSAVANENGHIGGFLPKGDEGRTAQALFERMRNRRTNSKAVIVNWNEAQKNNTILMKDPTTALNRMTDPSDTKGATSTYGQDEARAAAMEVIGKRKFTDEARADVEKRVNVHAAISGQGGYSRKSTVEDIMAHEGYAPKVNNADGSVIWARKDHSRPMVQNPKTGMMEPPAPFSVEEMQYLTKNVPPVLAKALNGGVYVSTDSLTGKGGGYVLKDVWGRPVTMRPGDVFPVGQEVQEALKEVKGFVFGEANVDIGPSITGGDQIMMTAPQRPSKTGVDFEGPDPHEIPINENLSLVYDPESDLWSIRAAMGPGQRTTVEEQERQRKILAREEALETARVKAEVQIQMSRRRAVHERLRHRDAEPMDDAAPGREDRTPPAPKGKPGTDETGFRTEEVEDLTGAFVSEDVRPPEAVVLTEAERQFRINMIADEIDAETPEPQRLRWSLVDPERVPVNRPPEDHKSLERALQDVINSTIADGTVGIEDAPRINVPAPRAKPKRTPMDVSDDEDAIGLTGGMEDHFQAMNQVNVEAGQYTEAATVAPDKSAKHLMFEHIKKWEGEVMFAYDDASRAADPTAWEDSKKRGRPTVGYGFNLGKDGDTKRREYARERLAEVKANLDLILDNEESLSEQQAIDLFDIVMREVRGEVLGYLGNETAGKLKTHQLQAIYSLVYNAGLDILGPTITRALHEGNWAIVEHEIRFDSGTSPARVAKMERDGEGHLVAGLKRRRMDEGDMWSGTVMSRTTDLTN